MPRNMHIFNATAYSDSPASTMFLLYFEQLKGDPVLVLAGTDAITGKPSEPCNSCERFKALIL